jgi:AmiR/NasT family two-component response regulator
MAAPKIMVIDDEPIIRMDIKEMLESENYQVVAEGKNGEEAVELAYKHKPDMIIMDVKMPVMDGLKASAIIRKISDCSILLLTAYSQKELVQEAKAAGVTAYLVKPISEDDLIPAVEIALGQRQKMISLKQDVSVMEQKLEERKLVEKAKGTLMDHFSLTEEDAFKWLRNQSMKKRVSLCKLAEQLLQSDKTKLTL